MTQRRQAELGAFVRERRGRVTPQDVGLPVVRLAAAEPAHLCHLARVELPLPGPGYPRTRGGGTRAALADFVAGVGA